MKSKITLVESAARTDDRVWFLASGTKKVGPMSEARVLERLSAGKVPAKTKAWKEGMSDWVPVSELPAFSGDAPARDVPPSRETPAAGFRQPYRVERADLWRAFELGFDPARVQVALGALGVVLAIVAAAGAALWLHWALGLVALLASGPAVLLTTALLLGALAYQTRKRIEGAPTPAAGEALAFAKDHLVALAASPILVGLLALVPPILLALKSVVSHLPVVGPAAAGLTFGIDLALSASLLFLALAASLAWHLVPSIVAFEETGVVATVRTLLATVRTRAVRLLLWPTRPLAALGATGAGLVLLALVVVAVPALLNAKALGVSIAAPLHSAAGSPQAGPSHEEAPAAETPRAPRPAESAAPSLLPGLGRLSFEPTVGLAGIAFWSAVLLAIVGAVLVSTANALTGLLYLACRAGNDELVTRDDHLSELARRKETARASN